MTQSSDLMKYAFPEFIAFAENAFFYLIYIESVSVVLSMVRLIPTEMSFISQILVNVFVFIRN